MVLNPGEKIHVVMRRQFEGDLRRHFAGEVIAASDQVARVEGYSFILDPGTGEFLRKPDRRVRLVSLVDGGLIINVLPAQTDIEELGYRMTGEGRLIITDAREFNMDVNEFGNLR